MFASDQLKTLPEKEVSKQDSSDESLIKALLSGGIHDISVHPAIISDKEVTKIKEEPNKDNLDMFASAKEKESSKELEEFNKALKENTDPVMLLSPLLGNPRPTPHLIEKFIKTTREQSSNKDSLNSIESVFDQPKSSKQSSDGVPLRINGGKVLGGNVRGGNILGGIISGGDVSGGEIQGGKISGGMFKKRIVY